MDRCSSGSALIDTIRTAERVQLTIRSALLAGSGRWGLAWMAPSGLPLGHGPPHLLNTVVDDAVNQFALVVLAMSA